LGKSHSTFGWVAGGFRVTANWYRVIRLTLWAIAVVIALFPAILESFAATALDESLLREVIFVVIPASALGLSTVLDYLCMNYQELNGTKFALSVISILLNMCGMFSGLVGFLVLPHDAVAVTQRQLVTFSILILLALLISLITEYLVSADNHRCHSIQRERARELGAESTT
jgi:hypothetical protein